MNQDAPALLWEITKKLQQSESFETALSDVLLQLTQAMGCEESVLWLLNVKDSRIYVVACVGKKDLTGASLDLDRGIPGAVTRSGQAELIADCVSDPRFEQVKGDIPRNVLTLPLKTQYDCLGCLQLTDRRESDFTREDVSVCSLTASLIAIALEERGISLAQPSPRKVLAALRDITCQPLPEDASLKRLSLNIYENETLAIMGESGCGVRTLLRLLNLSSDRSEVREGRFLAAGRDVLNAGADEVDDYHRSFTAYIYPECPLVPTMTVRANLEMATRNSIEPLTVSEALFLVGLEEHAKLLPEKLSPKERQLVGVARALAKKPDLILAEEPTRSLSAKDAKEVLAVLVSGARKIGSTLVIATHNPEIARIAERILTLREGRISRTYINKHPKAPAELVW